MNICVKVQFLFEHAEARSIHCVSFSVALHSIFFLNKGVSLNLELVVLTGLTSLRASWGYKHTPTPFTFVGLLGI